MPKYFIPQPQRVRRIEKSFAWIDHRLLRSGYLQVMTHQEQSLYLFLALAADRHGVSFYRKEKICDALGLDWGDFEVARDRLMDLKLIAFEPYNAMTPNGFYQVLPVDRRPPAADTAASESVRVRANSRRTAILPFYSDPRTSVIPVTCEPIFRPSSIFARSRRMNRPRRGGSNPPARNASSHWTSDNPASNSLAQRTSSGVMRGVSRPMPRIIACSAGGASLVRTICGGAKSSGHSVPLLSPTQTCDPMSLTRSFSGPTCAMSSRWRRSTPISSRSTA